MRKKKVAILASTGMVGRRYVSILSSHPYFEISCVAGHESTGKRYGDIVKDEGLNIGYAADLLIKPTKPEAIDADLIFSPLPTEAARRIEPLFAKAGFNVITDASAHRMESDVPLIIPEVNPEHLRLIDYQKAKRKWDGAIVATPNCTATALALVLKPIHELLHVRKVIVSTMQAVSGAGYPGVPSLDIIDNVIPYIENEEEKVQSEPLKILGTIKSNKIEDADIEINAMCHRVPTTDGHMESIYLETESEADPEKVTKALDEFIGLPQRLNLPSAPKKPIIVMQDKDRPQVRIDRYAGTIPGMSVVVGRVRKGRSNNSIMLTMLSHNTIRGAAGSTVLTAELMLNQGYLS